MKRDRMIRRCARTAFFLFVILCTCAVAEAQEEIVIDKLPMTLDKPGATYVMNRDLSCRASGVLIYAENITLDMKGHTITYGTGKKRNEEVITYNGKRSGNVGHHGIYVPGSPRHGKDAPVKIGWNGRLKGIVIRNGKIRHGNGGISYSDAILANGTLGCEIANMDIAISAPDSSAIIGGWETKIHDNRIVHTGTHVTNRHAQLGVIVSGLGSKVYNNTIIGGPQVGVKAMTGAEIHHNEIRQNATVTNCYGVQGYGQNNIHVHHNKIIPKNGRGIHVSEKSVGWKVHHNYVEVRETKNNEYPKGMWTHGIKLETCRDAKIHDNVVVSVSDMDSSPLSVSVPAPKPPLTMEKSVSPPVASSTRPVFDRQSCSGIR